MPQEVAAWYILADELSAPRRLMDLVDLDASPRRQYFSTQPHRFHNFDLDSTEEDPWWDVLQQEQRPVRCVCPLPSIDFSFKFNENFCWREQPHVQVKVMIW
jgi:hypothetical protein